MKGVAMRAARDVPRERPEALSRALDELRTGNELLATRVDELHALALGSHAAAVRARGCVLTTCAARARAAGAAGALRAWWLAARAPCPLHGAGTAVPGTRVLSVRLSTPGRHPKTFGFDVAEGRI